MEFIGEAAFTGTSLELSSREAQWSLSIRGIDGKNDSRFMEHHEKPVSAEDLIKFLPNWKEFVWQHIPDSMFSKSVSRAENAIYEMHIAATRDSVLSHDEVITAFEAFMASSG